MRKLSECPVVQVLIGMFICTILIAMSVYYSENYIFLSCGDIANLLTAIFAAIALGVSIVEYRNHIFSEYNKRYCEDKNIAKVIVFLQKYLDKDRTVEKPTLNEQEMFMRFFEELEYRIRHRSICEKTVKYYFSYYAVAFHNYQKDNKDNSDIKDYDSDIVWRYFKSFVNRFDKQSGAVD